MNGVQARKLRKKAEEMTIGQKAKEYELKKAPGAQMYSRPSIRLKPTCTRGLYQRMKKIFKNQTVMA